MTEPGSLHSEWRARQPAPWRGCDRRDREPGAATPLGRCRPAAPRV